MKLKLLNVFMFLMVSFSYGGPFSLQLYVKNCTCGANNGAISVSGLVGGAAPYTFLWSNSSTAMNLINLSPGTYTIYVTDQNALTDSATATVNNDNFISGGTLSYNPLPTPGYGISHPCGNQCNGVVYLIKSGMTGSLPYTLFSSNLNHIPGTYTPTNSPTLEGVCASDIYTATVYDANGCSGSVVPTSPYQPNSFAVNPTVAPACNGLNNGSISFDFFESFSFPYNLTWTGPSGTDSVNMFVRYTTLDTLLPGSYTITVKMAISVQPCDTSFTINVPDLGINCGVVMGSLYLDTIQNCLPDVNEPLLPGRLIKFMPGSYYGTTDATGNYAALLPYGTYSVSQVPVINYYPVCSNVNVTLSAANDTVTNINLGDSARADLDFAITFYSSAARPGFNFVQYGQVKNNSATNANASTITFTYPTTFTLISSSLLYTIIGPGQVELQLPTIGPFEVYGFDIMFLIDANISLIGTYFTNSALLVAGQSEIDLSNNTVRNIQIITGSIDPNEKAVWPNNGFDNLILYDVDPLVEYTIRFQNTGNDTAFNIVVIDTLNQYLNLDKFKFLGSSHPCRWEITGQNILKVYFDNILLPDSNINEFLSHGVFSFSTEINYNNLPPLQYILFNKADIYFDFNPPITTNTVFNTIDISVGINEFNSTLSGISVFPNPAHDKIKITTVEGMLLDEIKIFDLQGRLILEKQKPDKNDWLNIGIIKPGIYLLKAKLYGNDKGYSGVSKFVIN